MYSVSNPPTEAKSKAMFSKMCLAGDIKCPKCNRRYDFKINDQYYCRKCRYKFTLKRCLFCAHSKLSYTKIWILMHCWLSELSLQDTERITGLSHTTIRRWFRRFANLVPDEETRKLFGIVESDEAFVGRQRYDNQKIILGILERNTGKVILKIAHNRAQETLDRFILKNVDIPNSLLCTDAYSGYEHITEFFGFNHETINHSKGQFGITNRIENVWSRLKQFIKKVYHHVWKEHLPRIIKEFQARISYPEAFTTPTDFLSYVFHIS